MKSMLTNANTIAVASSEIDAEASLHQNNPHQTAVTKFIEASGNKYAYRSFGRKKGIPIVLFQHFTGTMDNWDPTLTNGLAKYFHVILFDNKGIGGSGGQTPDNIEAMAKDAISFINALGYEKINILGFSMGGFIAQQIVFKEPKLVNKLILAGTSHKGGENLTVLVKDLEESANMSPDEQKLFMFYSPSQTSQASGQQSLKRINRRQIDRDPDTKLASIQSQLKSILGWAMTDENSITQLKKIKQPVLVVNGNNDIVVPTINSYILFQNIPNAKLSLYPDSGHGAIFEYADLFLAEAIPFLKAE
ncbi:alpha/beta hydrolase [Pedobacter hiemivivus]|uniref:Alpha/beta hydrolase n=1 Tax=Pedobacter hiemivivus TaxID=2530454 RepID=A0A4V5PG83_9SPHI|nr:alpha/beta hydrolase [Pedobacter hiemivivus]TKC62226.1 alpha/beta hydrolase [Pedobacter hiemivivus]